MLLHTQSMHVSFLLPRQHTQPQHVRDATTSGGSARSRLLPIAHAKKKGKEQKNQGLYFEYEPVDAKAAEEVPIEKERLQEEFAWVRNARQNAQRRSNQAEPRKSRRGAIRGLPRGDNSRGPGSPTPPPLQARPPQPASQQPPATASSPSPAPLLTPPGLRPRLPARPVHPASAPPPSAVSAASSAAPPAGSLDAAQPGPAQAAARASEGSTARAKRQEAAAKRTGTVAVSDESRRERIARLLSNATPPQAGAGEPPVPAVSGNKLSERKQRLMSRMQARPTAAPSTASGHLGASPTGQPRSPIGGAAGSAAVTALAAAAAAAGAAASATPATPPPSMASGPSMEEMELLALPTLPPMPELPTEGLSEEELQAREVLQALLSLDPRQMAGGQQQRAGSLSEVYAREREAQDEFEAWVRELRASKAAAQQQSADAGSSGQGLGDAAAAVTAAAAPAAGGARDQRRGQEAEDEDGDDLRFLESLEGLEASATRLLASQGQGLEDFGALLSRLQSPEDFGASEAELNSDDGPTLSEEQVLAELERSDPELHALLTSSPPLDKEEEIDELTRALDSLARMGLGSPEGTEEGEAAAAAAAGLAAGTVEGGPEFEEEVSDAELLEAARYDPDLAALLRGEKVGDLDLDRALDRELGGDGDDDEDDEDLEALAGDMDGDVDFSDLFDALEEDPDIRAEDKAQAMQELQGMFNSAGKLGKGAKISKRDLLDGVDSSRGMTTTGAQRGEGEGEAPVPLLPRPVPKQL